MTEPDRKAEILRRVRATRRELEEALARVAEPRMEQPGVNGEWSIKDLLAHVAWWERHLLRRLRSGADDLYTPGVDVREATRRANAETFAASRDRPLDTVRAEFAASYRELLAALEVLPADEAARDEVEEAIGVDTFDHYPEHTAMLRAWAAAPEGPEKGGLG